MQTSILATASEAISKLKHASPEEKQEVQQCLEEHGFDYALEMA